MEIEVSIGSKTLACLINNDVFSSGKTVIDFAYSVNPTKIEMHNDFTSCITFKKYEAEKLQKYLKELMPNVSLGLRTSMQRLNESITNQLSGEIYELRQAWKRNDSKELDT